MAIKYWLARLEGTKSIDEVQAAIGGAGANIVRIHVEGGETHVYLAGDESLQHHVLEATQAVGGAREVQARTVTSLS
jgi:hypothetical protein